MNEKEIIRILTEEFSGNLWENYGKRRIYFNGADIASKMGLDTSRYNSGNISSARLDGDKISNSLAREILNELHYVKTWYDLVDGKFHWQVCQGPAVAKKMQTDFIAAAKAAIE